MLQYFFVLNDIKSISYIKLLKYRNLHKNRKAFILGNGPSLNIHDINKLNNQITFATNKIYLLFNDTTWRPTYYFVEDSLVFSQNYDEINNIKGTVKFFPTFTQDSNKTIGDGIYYKLHQRDHKKEFPQISTNALYGFHWGATVVYSMIQMALYMGITEIYLLGIDFSFDLPQDQKKSNELEIISEGEVNHFHKDYRKPGEKWHRPELDTQQLAFKKAKDFCNSIGISIYNSSRSSKLDVFEKIKLEDALGTNHT